MSNIKIVYEDDFIIVANKPPGLLTVPTPRKEKHTLSSLLKAYPAHRLDRDTSGLIILAKNKGARDFLMGEFKRRKVKKRYVAFAQGKLAKPKGVITGYLRDNPFEKPKLARTEYKVLEYKEGFSVVEVTPVTGRTNQIRIQFKQIGHPLVGERRFAFAKDFKVKFRRTALHSSGIEFIHPQSRKLLSFNLPLAEDMQKFLEK